MSFAGSLRPVLDADGQAVRLQAQGRTVLRYEGLKAWDATGRALPSRLEVRKREVRILVEDGGAVYPLTLDPVFVQETKLTASDAAAGDSLGQGVALSGDTAVVGANLADTAAGANAGAAYVFLRSGSGWSQQQKLTASDAAAGDQLGWSVAVDGDTAVAGARLADTAGGADAGAAYVLVRSGGVWTQQQKLTASDGAANDQFGDRVAVSGDTAVVAAPGADTAAGTDASAVYVFVRSTGVWTQQQKLTAADGAGSDFFGLSSLAVSGDTVVVGAPFDTTAAGSAAGSAYVFVRSGSAWNQNQKLAASDGAANDEFGSSVAVGGVTVLVGACCDDTGAGVDAGSAYVFTRRSKPQTIIVQQWGAGRDVPAPESARMNPRARPARLNQ